MMPFGCLVDPLNMSANQMIMINEDDRFHWAHHYLHNRASRPSGLCRKGLLRIPHPRISIEVCKLFLLPKSG
jgi:hypothetical protein